MDTIAELQLPANEFALNHTLATVPGVTFEAERITAHDTDRVLPLIWAAGGDPALVEATLHDDPTVENVELLTDLDNEQLYRMEWVSNIRFIVHMLVEKNAAILSASGSADAWCFRAIFPTRNSLSTTYEFCQNWNVNAKINSIYEMNDERYGRFGLTKEQSEVLVIALARGYYDLPRAVDMADLAEDLAISPQAVSERLRRAHRALVEDSMTIGHEADASRKQ